MEPKNHPIEKEGHLPNLKLEVPAVHFPECMGDVPKSFFPLKTLLEMMNEETWTHVGNR